MIRTENRAHRSRKLLLEIELVFARGGDKKCVMLTHLFLRTGNLNALAYTVNDIIAGSAMNCISFSISL